MNQSTTPKKTNLWTIAIGAALGAAVSVFVANMVGRAMQPSVESEIVKLCSDLNAQCPIIADKDTRLDSLAPGVGKNYSYNYTLVNMEKSTIDVDALKSKLEPLVTNRIKSSEQMKAIFVKNISVSYRYSDKNGLFLFEFTIKP